MDYGPLNRFDTHHTVSQHNSQPFVSTHLFLAAVGLPVSIVLASGPTWRLPVSSGEAWSARAGESPD